jgi:hypothetical protein
MFITCKAMCAMYMYIRGVVGDEKRRIEDGK